MPAGRRAPRPVAAAAAAAAEAGARAGVAGPWPAARRAERGTRATAAGAPPRRGRCGRPGAGPRATTATRAAPRAGRPCGQCGGRGTGAGIFRRRGFSVVGARVGARGRLGLGLGPSRGAGQGGAGMSRVVGPWRRVGRGCRRWLERRRRSPWPRAALHSAPLFLPCPAAQPPSRPARHLTRLSPTCCATRQQAPGEPAWPAA